MKLFRKAKITSSILGCIICLGLVSCNPAISEAQEPDPMSHSSGKKIKLALLLDTSNSMDGLINQAKSQLWTLVNELANADCDGEKPSLEIALYEYGNDRLPASENYIRLVTPLTEDLDKVSQDLFALKTNGGSEFCGAVIAQSLRELDWSRDSSDLQIIFIAGNEEFTQGAVPYYESCQRAVEKGVIVNTIFCGDFNEGVRTQWKHGAKITGGTYMSIDQNKVSQEIDTPYDDEIVRLNSDLNKTYIHYGAQGAAYRENQSRQDANALQYDKKALVKRSVSKSNYHYKKGSSNWDLVNKVEMEEEEAEEVISELDEDALPEEMKEMAPVQRVEYVKEKSEERKKIEKEIALLNQKRDQYLVDHSTQEEGMLDNALVEAIKAQAKVKNITITK